MGRIRKPTKVLESTAKRPPRQRRSEPDRHRADEPEAVTPISWDAPKHLDAHEKEAWKQLVDQALPGVLSFSDFAQLETAAVLLAEMRKKRARFSRFRDLMNALDRLGMTPSGRAGVKKPSLPLNGNSAASSPKKGFAALREEAGA